MGEVVPVHGDHTEPSRLTPSQTLWHGDPKGRPFYEMRETGVMWAINRVLFHPRGFALSFAVEKGTENVTGWQIVGHGNEVVAFTNGDEDVEFEAFTALLDSLRRKADDE
jgi:hypothetical protein